MMKIIKYLWLWMLFFLFPLYLSSDINIEHISTRTVAVFNTLCAKCHEGECSGRLSFETGSKIADNHIRHYAEDVNLSRDEIKEFFYLLNHMKTKCEVWMPDHRKWKKENLSDFALPSGKGYFIPLGLLKEGTYHMEIRIKDDIRFSVEGISMHFEHFMDTVIPSSLEKKQFKFSIHEQIIAFLRIQSRQSFEIIDLNIERSD